jgi:hypothetical protein
MWVGNHKRFVAQTLLSKHLKIKGQKCRTIGGDNLGREMRPKETVLLCEHILSFNNKK